MKKTIQLLATITTVFALLLVPVISVQAQSEDPIIIEDDFEMTPTQEDTDEVAGIPDTGIAPADNRLATNVAVFVGGSAIGAALGFGALALRKKYSQQTNE